MGILKDMYRYYRDILKTEEGQVGFLLGMIVACIFSLIVG